MHRSDDVAGPMAAAFWHTGDRETPVQPELAFGPNLRQYWVPTGRRRQAELRLPGAPHGPLVFEWFEYERGGQLSCMGSLFYRDAPLTLEESWIDIDVCNSGTTTRRAIAPPATLAGCHFLATAVLRESLPEFVPQATPDTWKVEYRHVDSGAVYNTVVYDSRSLTVEIDLAAMRARLTTVTYLDTST